MDLSDLLSKLTDLSSNRSGGSNEGSFQLRGEEASPSRQTPGCGHVSHLGTLGEGHKSPLKTCRREHKDERKSECGERSIRRVLGYGRDSVGWHTARVEQRSTSKEGEGPKAQTKEKRVRTEKARRKKKDR